MTRTVDYNIGMTKKESRLLPMSEIGNGVRSIFTSRFQLNIDSITCQ